MKKEFLYILSLTFVVCLSSDMYSMEVGQVTGKMEIGHAIYSWQVEGNSEYCDSMKKYLAGQQQSFTIPLPKDSEKPAIQIDPDGGLSINQVEHIIIVDQHGKTIIDTRKNQGQFDSDLMDESLDEGDNQDNEVQLQPGSSVTRVSSGSSSKRKRFDSEFLDEEDSERRAKKPRPGYSKVSVMYDSIINLVSRDGSEYPVRLSLMAGSTLIAVGLRHGKGKKEKKIKLESTGEEIKTFIDFVASNEEGRKKLLSELPIIEYIMLAADLHFHDFSKKFVSDPYVFTMRLLKSKIHTSLQKGELAWLQEILSWQNDRRMNAQRVIEEILRKIIKPVPKVLLMWKSEDNVSSISFSPNEKRAGISYKDGKGKLIDTDDGRVIFEDDNVYWIFFNPNEKIAEIIYKDGKGGKIIDPDDERVIFEFKDDNVCSKIYSSNGKRVGIVYKDGKGKIIDPDDRTIIFEDDNVDYIRLSPNGKMAGIEYKDGKGKIIDLDDKNREPIFKDDNVYSIEFSPNEKRAQIIYKGGKGGKIIDTDDERVIFEFKDDNIHETEFSPNGKMVLIIYEDGKGKIIDTDDERVIFELKDDDNVNWIELSPNGKMVAIMYEDGKGKIIDTDDERVIFEDDNLDWIFFSLNGKRAQIPDEEDGKERIIDVEDGTEIFKDDNVDRISLSPNGKRAGIRYEDGRWGIIDLEDYNRGIDFIKFNPEQLLFAFKLNQNPDYLDHVEDTDDAKRIWQSFKPELQQQLKRSYFPEVNFSLLAQE